MQMSSSNSDCLSGKDYHNEGGLAKHVLGTGKRISKAEREKYHPGIVVQFQEKPAGSSLIEKPTQITPRSLLEKKIFWFVDARKDGKPAATFETDDPGPCSAANGITVQVRCSRRRDPK